MRIAVVTDPAQVPACPFDATMSLFDASRSLPDGDIASTLPDHFRRTTGRTVDNIAWDFLGICLAVAGADRAVSRERTSPDGWTRQIELTISVSDPQRWTTVLPDLQAALRFLSGDLWSLRFIDGGFQPAPPARAQPPNTATSVSLLSGGLDSLIGAIDLRAAGEDPLFVSHCAVDKQRQAAFVGAVSAQQTRLLQLNHVAKPQPVGSPAFEISQRARSLSFIAYAVMAAHTTKLHQDGGIVTIYVPENGFISLNVPLTPLRTGSLSTRTTHPTFLLQMQSVFDRMGLRVQLQNQYQFRTKGEMMTECADQGLLRAHAPHSMSCGRSGRTRTHCGQCLPCLVRRGAFLKWQRDGGVNDTTVYRYPETGVGANDNRFRHYDDVVQAKRAIAFVELNGIRRWTASTITGVELKEADACRQVAKRGLDEIEEFFRQGGWL